MKNNILGKNASYKDYNNLSESKYPYTSEKIVEFWLNKYQEGTNEKYTELISDKDFDDIKVLAKKHPVYESGFDEGTDEEPGYDNIVLSVKVESDDENNGKECFLAFSALQNYEYVETRYDRGSYWDPPESEGYYEPTGDIELVDESPAFFDTLENAVKSFKNTKIQNYNKEGYLPIKDDDFIFDVDALLNSVYDEPSVSDPDSVYDSYHKHMMDLEDHYKED